MTAWEFAKSYLSPVMLFLRLCWLGMAAFAALLAKSGAMNIAPLYLWGFAAFLFWIAVRPWGTTNLSKISKRVDEASIKYR